ncbi:stathmin domain-containing protein 1 isoform X1 [Paroedura picta]|uniref:stathmin domain-containing protein 1 isoform X1 n=1 Tax=Paroedura picta TaxID=143630 RepID=UPI00405625C7
MGCSLSSKATGDQPSSKNEQHGKETNKKPKKNASLATVNTSPPRESVAEDSSYEGRLPGSITETLSLPKETNYEQNTVIRGESAKKPVGLTERERQTSADILEELRTQGIIKTASGAPQIGQGDDTMTRPEQLNQELLTDRASPMTSQERRNTGREEDSSTSGVQKASSTLQFLSLNLNTRSLTQKEKDECHSFEDFDVVESDANYNTINETF